MFVSVAVSGNFNVVCVCFLFLFLLLLLLCCVFWFLIYIWFWFGCFSTVFVLVWFFSSAHAVFIKRLIVNWIDPMDKTAYIHWMFTTTNALTVPLWIRFFSRNHLTCATHMWLKIPIHISYPDKFAQSHRLKSMK